MPVTCNYNMTLCTLTFGLCACRWWRRPCGSRGWRSWTSWCLRWCTRHCEHRNGWRSGRRADRHTEELQRNVCVSIRVLSIINQAIFLIAKICQMSNNWTELNFRKQTLMRRSSEWKMFLLLRWTASIKGRSLGCRLSSKGVPIRSWGR